LIFGIALPGCELQGGAPAVSSSAEEATVKGTVRLHGKVNDNGNIVFHCANINRPNTAGLNGNTDGLFGSISLPSGTTRRSSGDD
jgi:hypothetical protein